MKTMTKQINVRMTPELIETIDSARLNMAKTTGMDVDQATFIRYLISKGMEAIKL